MRVQIILGSLVIPHATRTSLKRPQTSEIFNAMSDVVSDNHVQKIRFSNSLLFVVVLTPCAQEKPFYFQTMFDGCINRIKQCICVHSAFPNARVRFGDSKLLLSIIATPHTQQKCCSFWDYSALRAPPTTLERKKAGVFEWLDEFPKQNASIPSIPIHLQYISHNLKNTRNKRTRSHLHSHSRVAEYFN